MVQPIQMLQTLSRWYGMPRCILRVPGCTPVYDFHNSISVARWSSVRGYVSSVLHCMPDSMALCQSIDITPVVKYYTIVFRLCSFLGVVEEIHKKHFLSARGSFCSRTNNAWGVATLIDISCSAGRPHLASQQPATLHHEQRSTSTQLPSGHGI